MTLQSLENYGLSFQTKVLSALLTDKPFLQNVNDILTDDYFNNLAHKWIINEILKYLMNILKTRYMNICYYKYFIM